MAKTLSELYILKIENSIRAIKLGKKPEDVNPSEFFAKLKPLNDGMHDDLLGKYQNVVNDYNRKQLKK